MPYGPGSQYGPYGYAGPPSSGYSVPPLSPYQPRPESGGDPLISLNYGGWWQRGVILVKRCWKPLALLQGFGLLVTLALQIPLAVSSASVMERLTNSLARQPSDAAEPPDLSGFVPVLGYSLLASLGDIVVRSVIVLAAVHVMVMAVTGARSDGGVVLRGSLRRAFPLVGWQLLATVVVLAGFCACILPGVYFVAVFLALPAVVAFERGGAIGRCFRLFHGDIGSSLARVATIAGLQIGVSGVAYVLGSVIQAVVTSSAGTGGLVTATIISSVLGAVLGAAAAMLVVPLTLLTYADMRARLEPVTTAVFAQELGLAAPAAGPGAAAGGTPAPVAG